MAAMTITISPSTPPTGTPTSLPNLMFWFAADSGVYSDTAGTTLATDGQGCANWADLSSNGFTVTQSTGAQRPIYTTGSINSLPALVFTSASSQFLANTATALQFSNPYTCFFVCSLNWDDNTNFRTICASGDYAGGAGVNVLVGGSADDYSAKSVIAFGLGATSGVAPRTTAAHGQSGTGWRIVDINNGSKGQVFINGVSITKQISSAGFPVGRNGLYLGKSGSGFSNYMSGSIAEIIYYDRSLAINERSLVREYLGVKYGINV